MNKRKVLVCNIFLQMSLNTALLVIIVFLRSTVYIVFHAGYPFHAICYKIKGPVCFVNYIRTATNTKVCLLID